MGQKINPVSLRIQSKTRYLDSAWYSDYFFSNLISTDIAISRYLNNFLKSLKLPLGRFSIYHFTKSSKLYNFFCYPKQSREYKSKVFHISSGLSVDKYNKAFENIKFKKQGALSDLELFQSNGVFTKKNITNLPLFLNLRLLSVLGSKQNFINKSQNKLFPSLNYLQHISKNKEIFKDKNENEYKAFINQYLVNSTYKKSITEKNQILLIFKELIILSKVINSSYRISSPNSKNLNNKLSSTFFMFDNQKKYNDLLENHLNKYLKTNITLIPFQAAYEWQDAGYFADEIVFLLERHFSFRQIKNRILKQLSTNPYIQGIRITCSGRVGGKSKKAQRAKIDSIKYGQTSLNVFSSKIDFATRTAYTPLGSTGVKIWICYK